MAQSRIARQFNGMLCMKNVRHCTAAIRHRAASTRDLQVRAWQTRVDVARGAPS